MSKKDEFKNFALKHPELSQYVKNNKVTWQKLYELYDIYGEKEDVWEKYLKTNEKDNISVKGILNTLKNINIDSLEENIASIQKAASFIEELTRPNEKKETKERVKAEEKIERFYSD